MQLNKYCNLMKIAGKEKYFSIRKSIVLEALKNGIKPTAEKKYVKKQYSFMDEAFLKRRK